MLVDNDKMTFEIAISPLSLSAHLSKLTLLANKSWNCVESERIVSLYII